MIVTPETVVNWHRKGFKLYWRWISRCARQKGRMRIDKEIKALIEQMANDNPTWGAPRIHGELLKLGFKVSERSVSRYMPKMKPGNKIRKWMFFLKNQWKGIAAMDFFIVPTITIMTGRITISTKTHPSIDRFGRENRTKTK